MVEDEEDIANLDLSEINTETVAVSK